MKNRVLPDGGIIEASWRGAFMGNRGILHDAAGTPGPSRWRHPHWVTCTLNRRDGRAPHPISAPGRYTPLFFTDEAVACAAGHRPCAQCRPQAFHAFQAAWHRAFGTQSSAPEIDKILHAARVRRDRSQITHEAEAEALPFGVFFLCEGAMHLRSEAGACVFDPGTGTYGPQTACPKARVVVLTPQPMVAVMAAGWRPCLSRDEDTPRWPHQPG